MRVATYLGGIVGLATFVALCIHADIFALLHTLRTAGWPVIWLIPFRTSYFLLYAAGWFILLWPSDPQGRAGLGYLFWVTTVREAVDRLLPVASVGGSVIGVRLVRWRGLASAPVGASVIVEIVLTLIVSYVFTALGFFLAVGTGAAPGYRAISVVFLSIPIPVATVLLLRHGSLFERVQGAIRPWMGAMVSRESAAALDREVRASLRRTGRSTLAAILQLLALLSASFEVWLPLRLFGHPVTATVAIILESMVLAMRHLAFWVPAGLGVQEAGFVLVGQAFGVDSELALAVSMAKRLRELSWGVISLISWQGAEGLRLRTRRV